MSTGPPAKLLKRVDDLRNNDQIVTEEVIEFFIRLCGDVLVDVLCYGHRRRLIKLERVGRRFQAIVENFFGEKPFLGLDIKLCNSGRMLNWKVEFPALSKLPNLDELPKFVRFKRVELEYCDGYNGYGEHGCAKISVEKRDRSLEQSIAEKCQSLVKYLQPLKEALNNLVLIYFVAIINANDGSCFSDSSKLLNHVQNEVIPICNSSRGYRIEISYFESKMNDCPNVIASILQMNPFIRCSHLEIIFHRYFRTDTYGELSTWSSQHAVEPPQLPIERISNWLHRKSETINENSKKRFLRINLSKTQNALELLAHLQETFEEDECVRPFAFQFNHDPYKLLTDYGVHKFTNKKTNEELSICGMELKGDYAYTVIRKMKEGEKQKK